MGLPPQFPLHCPLHRIHQHWGMLGINIAHTLHARHETLHNARDILICSVQPRPSNFGPRISQNDIHQGHILGRHAPSFHSLLHRRHRIRNGILVSQRVQHSQPQLIRNLHRLTVQLGHELLQMPPLIVGTRQILLERRNIHETAHFHQPRQLSHDRHVLRHRVRLTPQLGILVQKLLHILDGFQVGHGMFLRSRLIILQELLNGLAQLPKVGITMISKEGIVIGRRRQYHLLQILGYVGHSTQYDATVVQSQ
mmetsp:Transcript_1520/g.2594  ORF Transcript_1520/g.2594 Transcript_1520/m.2594 type:complete len:253 (-) Transcript_1520:216-974(-)